MTFSQKHYRMSDKTNVCYYADRSYYQNINYKPYISCLWFNKFGRQNKDDLTFDSKRYSFFIKNPYFEIQ